MPGVKCALLLIEPVWNRNISQRWTLIILQEQAFNRTSMESKHEWSFNVPSTDAVELPFNRTSMESKPCTMISFALACLCCAFNRTSMESKQHHLVEPHVGPFNQPIKLDTALLTGMRPFLLIEPVWNRNETETNDPSRIRKWQCF